jgi:predicted nucleic acid-binding Zn ribbon protein
MLACPGCGGRNPPELSICSVCHRRLDTQTGASRALRPRLVATLLLALVVGMVLLVLIRSAFLV